MSIAVICPGKFGLGLLYLTLQVLNLALTLLQLSCISDLLLLGGELADGRLALEHGTLGSIGTDRVIVIWIHHD